MRAPFNGFTPVALLAHFQKRTTVRAFPVLDETQISRAKTEQVLNDCFAFNEETHHLPAGFDWLTNPSRDEEWLILLHKFYYATGLGQAYDATRDERYARKWVELTDSWLARTPLDSLPTDVTGRRLQNWLSAHEYFVARHLSDNRAASVTPTFYGRFLHSLHQQTAHLRANLTPARNHRTLELWALFFVAVTFPEFNETAEWLAFTVQELTHNAQSDLLADGVHCELSTDYHHLALRNFLYVARLAQLNDIELPAAFHVQVRKTLDIALYAHKPDGEIPSLSDGDCANYLSLLAQRPELYGNETWLYAATRGEQGCAPTQRSRGFAASGYYVLRSGWGARERYENERYLIIERGTLRIDAPHLVIAQPCDENVTPTIETGFVSHRYGVKHPAPVINFARRASDASFYTILFPYQHERPDIMIERLPVNANGRACDEREAVMLCVTITRGGVTHKDYFLLTHQASDELYSCGVVSFRGRLLHMRTSGHSKLLQWHLIV